MVLALARRQANERGQADAAQRAERVLRPILSAEAPEIHDPLAFGRYRWRIAREILALQGERELTLPFAAAPENPPPAVQLGPNLVANPSFEAPRKPMARLPDDTTWAIRAWRQSRPGSRGGFHHILNYAHIRSKYRISSSTSAGAVTVCAISSRTRRLWRNRSRRMADLTALSLNPNRAATSA
jgi:hypothetical protein